MKTIKLGRNGPQVTTIGFGAWAIGGMNWGPTDDAVSKRALHAAMDEGVTLIDTADVYGFGHSENLVASVLREKAREHVIIATKAGNDFYEAGDLGMKGVKPNYSKEYLVSACERSLERLGVDCVDILQLHSPNRETLDQDEPWAALDQLKREGKIRWAGLSIQSFKETEQSYLLDRHAALLDIIQVRYNLLEREAEDVLFPKALEHGIGVIVRIPLLFGLLTGKFDRNSTFHSEDHRRMNLSPEKLDSYLVNLEKLKPLFDSYPDQTMGQVGLRFCITHPACHTAIPGAKTPEQVRENCKASRLGPLPKEAIPSRTPS